MIVRYELTKRIVPKPDMVGVIRKYLNYFRDRWFINVDNVSTVDVRFSPEQKAQGDTVMIKWGTIYADQITVKKDSHYDFIVRGFFMLMYLARVPAKIITPEITKVEWNEFLKPLGITVDKSIGHSIIVPKNQLSQLFVLPEDVINIVGRRLN